MNKKASTRRQFLSATGQMVSGGWLALNAPLLMAASQAAEEQRARGAAWENLTQAEAAVCTAVVDQIIPPDDLPGASEAGVVYFIDQVMGGFMADAAPMLREGLAGLDAMAVSQYPGAAGFAGLAFAQQTAILESVETTPFFETMIFLTHCGLFANPRWGGNREQMGWNLIGFDSRHAWQPPFGYYDAQFDKSGGSS